MAMSEERLENAPCQDSGNVETEWTPTSSDSDRDEPLFAGSLGQLSLIYGLFLIQRTRSNRNQIMKERWLSVAEIAAHLGVNPDTIYKWIERKQLPAHKVGRLWKFTASEVDQWVRAGKVADPEQERREEP